MKRALIGGGGHAREVAFQLKQNLPFFVDDEFVDEDSLPLSTFDPSEYEVMVAIGDSRTRRKIIDKLPPHTKYFTFIHQTAILGKDCEVGDGTFIGAYCIITSNVSLGQHTILSRGNHVGHDNCSGAFLSMMPGSIISGNVTLGEEVYLGTNSSIRENLYIANSTTIGMGSAVISDIKTKGTYAGVPAKKIHP